MMRIRVAWLSATRADCRSGDADTDEKKGGNEKSGNETGDGCADRRPGPPQTVVQRIVDVPAGATVAQALDTLGTSGPAGWQERLANGRLAVAVFGRPAALTTILQADDRIELVGPLSIDPKAARRRRVQQQREGSGDVRWHRRGETS